ncbi:MAG: hypothetical protein JXB13_07460 [Phycisphaerae bacterium]|nr:hypothetical protein [Phycisphaerae bacterium]
MKKKRVVITLCGLIVLVLAGVGVWWRWVFVPLPSYVPHDDHWRLVDKQTTHSWGRPCVYGRYEVSLPVSEAGTQLRDIITGLREWERLDERTSEAIVAKIRERWPPEIEVTPDRIIMDVAPLLGWKFALRTDLPFVVLSWYGYEEPTMHHRIVVRIIEAAPDKCIVELWGFRIFDL